MEFIDRDEELAFLEGKWREPGPQLIILWGKKRVGKTELVKQFQGDKPNVYFLAESTNEREQLHRFSQALGQFFDEPLLRTRGFSGWEESFRKEEINDTLCTQSLPPVSRTSRAGALCGCRQAGLRCGRVALSV